MRIILFPMLALLLGASTPQCVVSEPERCPERTRQVGGDCPGICRPVGDADYWLYIDRCNADGCEPALTWLANIDGELYACATCRAEVPPIPDLAAYEGPWTHLDGVLCSDFIVDR